MVASAPWWVGALLAVVALVVLQGTSGLEVRPPAGPKGIGSFVVLEGLKLGASMLRWLVPPLLLLAACASFLRHRRSDAPTRRAATASTRMPRPVLAKVDESWDRNIRQQRAPRIEPLKAPVAPPSEWTLDVLTRMDWKRFEALTAAYYKHLGFRAETIQCGPDGGIDVKLFRGDAPKPAAIVQCKAWSSRPVGVKPVRELLGVMVHNNVDTGVFLTTSGFTGDAVDFAKSHRIALGSGDQLLGKLKALPEQARRQLLAVAVEGDWTTPSCPSCGTKMVVRHSEQKSFWGCVSFPRCRRTFPRKRVDEEAARAMS